MQLQSGWINDPNGMVKFQGKYHLYFQYLPRSTTWKYGIGWGHATSYDLKNWNINKKRSLKPSTEYDRDGCFSGCAMTCNDKIYSVYTGVVRENESKTKETQCMAYSEDGDVFHKFAMPFLEYPPFTNVYGWRDPFVFKYDNEYYILIGSGWDKKANILLYKGDDTFPCRKWEYKGVIASIDEPVVLECPFIAKLNNNTWILGGSCEHKKPIYWIGEFDGNVLHAFNPDFQILENHLDLDIYAPTIVYIDNTPYFWTWIRNERQLYGPCKIVLNEKQNSILPLIQCE